MSYNKSINFKEGVLMLNAICIDTKIVGKTTHFVVYDTYTEKKEEFDVINFFGTIFKTESSFERVFKNAFPDRQMIFYSRKALEQINALVEFNRVDS